MFRVGAYVRLSAEDKKKKGDSIENQQAIIRAHIAEHPDLELADTYIDSQSGQTFDRPGFQRMLADLESGRIDACATKDLSRLGRSAIDTGYYIEKYFPARGIRYIAINDGYDSADPKSGGVMVSLKNMVNEHYALEVGRKIHATKQMNIRNGCFVGALPPYGYLKSPEDNHRLVADPVAGPNVARMFEMAAGGKGVSAIAEWLNTGGAPAPLHYFHSIGVATAKQASGSAHWTKAVIYSMLKNRVYTGDMVQGKGRCRRHVQERLARSEWVVTPDTHEPTVSRELFAEVQKLWEGNKEARASYKRHSDNIFLRKIFCGHCGFAMQRQRYKHSAGFRCSTERSHAKGDCRIVSISEGALKETLLATLRKQAEIYAGRAAAAAEPKPGGSELREAQAGLERCGGLLKGLYESLASGDITEGEYRELKQGYEAKSAALADRANRLREVARAQALESARRAKAAGSIGALGGAADLTAEAVDALIDKIRVFEDKRIEVRFKFSDETAISDGGAKPRGGRGK
ncbi:MAG: recombinase family protein [Clostridiales bacterium]|nr:recombinase family protein [Clostridiales bacterium]